MAMFHGSLKKNVFYCCWVRLSINFDEILCLVVLLSYFISVVFLCSCLILIEEVIKFYKCNFEFLNLFQFFLIFTSHVLLSCCLVHILLKLLYLLGGLTFWSLYNLPPCLVIFFALKSTSFSDINIVSPAFLWIMLHDWSFPILNIFRVQVSLVFKNLLTFRERGRNIDVRMNIISFGCLLHTLYCCKPGHVSWRESTGNPGCNDDAQSTELHQPVLKSAYLMP